MRIAIRARRMARFWAAWLLLIAGCVAAQEGGPSGAALPKGTESQLHADLELAAAAMHKGELASAEEALRQALTIDPHSLVALNNLGIVLSREGKPAEAIPLY